jgi:very-short-patch-repair endonuclease
MYGQKEIGFLICPSCGSVRYPKASDSEIANFMEEHQKRCFIRDTKFFWNALHTDLESDLIIFEDFTSASIAANFLESIKLGAIEVLDVREFDIDGIVESKDNGHFNVVFYDSLPGGSGYLSLFLENLPLIVEKALSKLNACDCEDVCYKCLLNYSNQQYHNVLNRIEAINLLESYKKAPIGKMLIPKNAVPKKSENKTDSPAEEAFLDILRKNNFPEPTQQYEIELRGNETTIADFAYIDKKVLIYIDGLSTRYHGNPIQAEKDKIKRTKAKLLGWSVLEIAANALKDESLVEMYLELLAGWIK